MSTARAPIPRSFSPAARMSSSSSTGSAVRSEASGTFGVKSAARGRRSSRSASTASGRSSRCPLFATITGSTTTRNSWSSTAFATARMMAAEDSMPVFAAPTGKSETTAAI